MSFLDSFFGVFDIRAITMPCVYTVSSTVTMLATNMKQVRRDLTYSVSYD